MRPVDFTNKSTVKRDQSARLRQAQVQIQKRDRRRAQADTESISGLFSSPPGLEATALSSLHRVGSPCWEAEKGAGAT